MKLLRLPFLVLLLLLWPARVHALDPVAHPADATIRIKSHGASATIIATTAGRSWILGCAHMIQTAAERSKKFVIDGPPQPHAPALLAPVTLLAWDFEADLSLLQIDNGPFNYLPVARPGHQPGNTIYSCGYDSMKWPITAHHASILNNDGHITWTRESPWHGRSGGCLADAGARVLIGVVQGYEVGPGQRPSKGLYVSHQAILRFLEKNKSKFQAPRGPPQGQPIAPPLPPAGTYRAPYIEIQQSNRIPNRTGGQCVWSSLETLARHHGISQLYDLTQRYRGTAGPGEVESVLRGRGVQFRQQHPGSKSRSILQEASTSGRGCLIGLAMSHAVVCVGCDEAKVFILDNCGPHLGKVQEWSWGQFMQRWDGWAVILYAGNASPQTARPGPEYHQPFMEPAPACPG